MKNILIVDDDKTNLISAKNALHDTYKVFAVPSGAQALKFLEKKYLRFDSFRYQHAGDGRL